MCLCKINMIRFWTLLLLFLCINCCIGVAQVTTFIEQTEIEKVPQSDTLTLTSIDSLTNTSADADTTISAIIDHKVSKIKTKRDWSTWRPNSTKALWLALVIPGGGQIYNRKYWKLPIFYGGMVGCIYALNWNGQMYKDYAQAYTDLLDDDPNTQSYNQFLHLGVKITDANKSKYEQIFKSRKDRYRRWRDLSFFCMIGVYAISVIDAYIDAEMSDFDLSNNLSMKIRPTVMSGKSLTQNSIKASSVGVACSLKF